MLYNQKRKKVSKEEFAAALRAHKATVCEQRKAHRGRQLQNSWQQEIEMR